MISKPSIILLLMLLPLSALAQQTYHLNIKKSKILWNNGNAMGGHYGYIHFNSGSLNYSATGDPINGLFSIDMNSMRSTDHALAADNQKVDKELRTEGFFAMDKYPEATMNVKQITKGNTPTEFNITGDLTIKGITNPITFTATIKKNGDIITAVAKTRIHRLKWHIDMQSQPQTPKVWDVFTAVKNKLVADEIEVSLNLVFDK